MGHIYVDARVSAERSAKVRFMVDTGATFSLVPAELAKKVGLRPVRRRDRVRLANGRIARLGLAAGLIRIDGREAGSLFWIGPCDEPLLGVETLEALGLAVDPAHGRLRPTRPYATRLGGLGRRQARGRGCEPRGIQGVRVRGSSPAASACPDDR